jgi:hypothetical protein
MEDVHKRMDPSVFALSGVIANELTVYEKLPVINSMKDIGRLTDLVEKTAKDWKPV